MEGRIIKLEKYGRMVRELREQHGDTREILANKLDISISALRKYETGERIIKPAILEKIAEIYDVKLSTFFGEEAEVPEELKAIGVEWITFAKEMKEKNLTPEQIKAALEFIDKFGLNKK
jgi:transcriptional regulator with XRE-family HTH domain